VRRSPQVVRRCPNHASRPAPAQSGEAAAAAPPEHLLVCEHKRARYDDDPYTGRLSVVIPHEPPQGTTEMDMGWVHPWVGLGWVAFSSTCYGLGVLG